MYDDDQAKAAKEAANQREMDLMAMNKVMQSVTGRRFMARCIRNCGTFERIFNSDIAMMSHNEGKRDHGLWLCSELKRASPEKYYEMLREMGD